MKTMHYLPIAAALLCSLSVGVPRAAAAEFADVIVIADESGSMSGEHAWLGGMITQLDSELMAAGVGSGSEGNRFALVGFASSGTPAGRQIAGFGTSAQFAAATSSLLINGGTEDGYSGINFALSNLSARNGSALNVILVTDEDRDNLNSSLDYSTILSLLGGRAALLNVVVNNPFDAVDMTDGLGMDSMGNVYFADGAGSFTTETGGIVGNGYGSTEADYVDLAFANGGAAWDLNQLRAGGLVATSFTEAFIDIKVAEIIIQPPQGAVPEPSTYGLLGSALLIGLVWLRRRAKR